MREYVSGYAPLEEATMNAFFAYQTTYRRVHGLLTPGEVVPPDLDVSFINFPRVEAGSFSFRERDTLPIEGVIWPGKSAHVAFTEEVDDACRVVFGRPAKESDCLYTVSPGDLKEIGYFPYSAPFQKAPLHVRVVHESQIHRTRVEPPRRARVKLADLLMDNRVR